jgi:hypothetical protein
MNAYETYIGSNADATRLLYAKLTAIGPVGIVATNLFRAVKCSSRAKGYHRRDHSREAYGRKQWSIQNVCDALSEHAASLGIVWGWGEDRNTMGYPWVLYVEIPTGQVSFHSPVRGSGPDYPGEWDHQKEASHTRICQWTQGLLDTHPDVVPARELDRSAPLLGKDKMPFGKHKDKPLEDVPYDYLRWFLDQQWAEKWPALMDYAITRKPYPPPATPT